MLALIAALLLTIWPALPSPGQPPQEVKVAGQPISVWKQKLTSNDALEVCEALEVVGRTSFQEIIAAYAERMEFFVNHPDSHVRVKAMNNFAEEYLVNHPIVASAIRQHLALVEKAARDADMRVRESACRLLGELATRLRPLPQVLYTATEDDEPQVRCAALEALRLSGRKSPKVLNCFRRAWNDADATVRLAAWRGLTCCHEHLTGDDWKRIRELFRKERGEPRIQAALLLLLAGQADDTVVNFLTNLLQHDQFDAALSLESMLLPVLPDTDLTYPVTRGSALASYRECVCNAMLLAPKVPDPLMQSVIKTVTERGPASNTELFLLLRAPQLPKSQLDALYQAAEKRRDARGILLVLALKARDENDKSVHDEVFSAVEKKLTLPANILDFCREVRERKMKEVVPLLRILAEDKDPLISRSTKAVLYYFTRDDKVLQALLQELQSSTLVVLPLPTALLDHERPETQMALWKCLDSLLNGRNFRGHPVVHPLLFELTRMELDPPDQLMPKVHVLFWTISDPALRILLAEVLYRKEAYPPARAMLETLANQQSDTYLQRAARESLARLRLTENQPVAATEKPKTLPERWQAMERTRVRLTRYYPLVLLPNLPLHRLPPPRHQVRVDLLDPLLEEIRQQNPTLAGKLEEID